jgi:hypothetical protein
MRISWRQPASQLSFGRPHHQWNVASHPPRTNHVNTTDRPSQHPAAMPSVRVPALHPPELLARIGRCLSFGCDEAQTRRAAGLVRRIAHDGATLRAAQLGALAGDGQGIVRRARIELPQPVEGSQAGLSSPPPRYIPTDVCVPRQSADSSSTCVSLGVTSSTQLLSGIAERLFEQKMRRAPTAEERAVIRRGSRHLSTEDWTVNVLQVPPIPQNPSPCRVPRTDRCRPHSP